MSWVRRLALIGTVAGACVAVPAFAAAQGERRVDPSPVELAIAVGRLDIAESALFEDIRRSPRGPAARGALGAYLAARGRFEVGITLFEEAMQFGGDSTQIQNRLLELFRWTAQYDRAAALSYAHLSTEAREALRRAGAAGVGGVQTATVPLLPNEAFGLGRITIAVGSERVEADVQPLVTGVQLPATMALFGAVEVIGARGDTTFAVARAIDVGKMTIGALPVQLIPSLQTARIGLDVLAQLTPTFDFAAKTLTLGAGRPVRALAERWPLLLTFPGVSFVAMEGSGPVLLHAPAGRAAVRGTRWTLDLNSGAIIVER